MSHDHDSDVPVFFPKKNPLNLEIYYDEKKGYVATARLKNGTLLYEKICDPDQDVEAEDVIDDVMGALRLMLEQPHLLNDSLKRIFENIYEAPPSNSGPAPSAKKVVQLVRKP